MPDVPCQIPPNMDIVSTAREVCLTLSMVQDYLNAPMPFLIGIPAPQLLHGLKYMGLEEVVFVDLDAGTCTLGSQDGPPMDYALLPWAHHLRAAFQVGDSETFAVICLAMLTSLIPLRWASKFSEIFTPPTRKSQFSVLTAMVVQSCLICMLSTSYQPFTSALFH